MRYYSRVPVSRGILEGFLADEMWDRIFNYEQVQQYPSLVYLLKNDFDFESVYNEVMDGTSYPPD
jgi:hypothetical protein